MKVKFTTPAETTKISEDTYTQRQREKNVAENIFPFIFVHINRPYALLGEFNSEILYIYIYSFSFSRRGNLQMAFMFSHCLAAI